MVKIPQVLICMLLLFCRTTTSNVPSPHYGQVVDDIVNEIEEVPSPPQGDPVSTGAENEVVAPLDEFTSTKAVHELSPKDKKLKKTLEKQVLVNSRAEDASARPTVDLTVGEGTLKAPVMKVHFPVKKSVQKKVNTKYAEALAKLNKARKLERNMGNMPEPAKAKHSAKPAKAKHNAKPAKAKHSAKATPPPQVGSSSDTMWWILPVVIVSVILCLLLLCYFYRSREDSKREYELATERSEALRLRCAELSEEGENLILRMEVMLANHQAVYIVTPVREELKMKANEARKHLSLCLEESMVVEAGEMQKLVDRLQALADSQETGPARPDEAERLLTKAMEANVEELLYQCVLETEAKMQSGVITEPRSLQAAKRQLEKLSRQRSAKGGQGCFAFCRPGTAKPSGTPAVQTASSSTSGTPAVQTASSSMSGTPAVQTASSSMSGTPAVQTASSSMSGTPAVQTASSGTSGTPAVQTASSGGAALVSTSYAQPVPHQPQGSPSDSSGTGLTVRGHWQFVEDS